MNATVTGSGLSPLQKQAFALAAPVAAKTEASLRVPLQEMNRGKFFFDLDAVIRGVTKRTLQHLLQGTFEEFDHNGTVELQAILKDGTCIHTHCGQWLPGKYYIH